MEIATIMAALSIATKITEAATAALAGNATVEQVNLLRAQSQQAHDDLNADIEAARAAEAKTEGEPP